MGTAALVASTRRVRPSSVSPSWSSHSCYCYCKRRADANSFRRLHLQATSPPNHDASLESSASPLKEEQQQTRLSKFEELSEQPSEPDAVTPIIINNNNNNNTNTTTSAWWRWWQDLPSAQSVLLLNAVAIIWGTQHAIIKTVVQDSDAPGPFTLLRFGIAALLASPYTPGLLPPPKEKKSSSNINHNVKDDESSTTRTSTAIATAWRWGAEMGFWMFLGFSFQAIGLEFTTAQKSGFLLYLNVKFVPFLARILLGRDISIATWVSALVAFVGTALLAMNPNGDQDSLNDFLNIGDLWSIAAAAASAMFILRLERASAAVPNAAALNAACLWVVVALAAVWTLVQPSFPSPLLDATLTTTDIGSVWSSVVDIATTHPLEMIYLSGVTTALANWIQSKAQRNITAERASVIYAMDPVYGAAFSNWWLGESLSGIQGWIGAGMITVAAATNAFLDLSNKTPEKQHVGNTTKEDVS